MQLHPYLLPAVLGLAIALFSIVGVARVVGWAPESTGTSVTASEVRAGPRCPECGMIVSIRKIVGPEDASVPTLAPYRTAGERNPADMKPATSYDIVVRMADGSSRAIRQARPASWQPGERVLVIGGAGPPGPDFAP